MTRGAETLAPFNLLESQELLHYLKSDQTTVPDVDPPLTALLPSLSARKTSLVSWILVNVGTCFVFPSKILDLICNVFSSAPN